MQLLLQEGEEIVKSWSYGKSREKGIGGNKAEMRMTVTNKRVVNTLDGKKSFAQSEVPLNKIKSISGSCGKTSSLGLLIAGILCVFSMILIVVGVILLVLYSHGGNQINLHIDLDGDASTGIALSNRGTKSKNKKTKVKVKIDYEAAKQMIAELGTVVQTLQAKS